MWPARIFVLDMATRVLSTEGRRGCGDMELKGTRSLLRREELNTTAMLFAESTWVAMKEKDEECGDVFK
jgi:hypothetical protein